ncbi:VQ motif-containing protein 22-like [Hibiscus syriacus]|uniref:VQ motif-containing protein 22-like n=1 Tax=Hibiscus syriacus TaxID=106335 RepID=UPI001924FA6A|nr:VQ motif-containing protein 22-like [Hibiscus syriacus]
MQPKPVHDIYGVTKNPKKRTRASRKAPTTVLTTDPTNFRAMVQEFTGIPAPPFSSSSSFPPRLDLFGSNHLEALRSSTRRVQPAATPLLNNIPLNMLNLQNQMVQPLSHESSVSGSTMASLDELAGFSHGGSASLSGLHGNLRHGVVGLNDGNQAHLRTFGTNFKLDYSVSSSDFHHEKGFENLPSRAEGTVDSWTNISPAE